jgi:dihydrodipicolinate synthase/N-acetylneuraminate lyase
MLTLPTFQQIYPDAMYSLTGRYFMDDPLARYPAATVACFDPTTGNLPRRRLDHTRHIAFLERLAVLGVPAVLIAASTGHGHLRTVEELEEWFESAGQANLGATVKMALLRPEDGEEANRRLLNTLVELGYPVVFIRPGTNLPRGATAEQVAANMQPLLEEAARGGMAVGIYSIPDVSGVPLTPAAAGLLAAGPGGDHLVAIKVTEADYEQSTLRFLSEPRLGRLKIVQGWDPHLARALKDGPRHDAAGRQRCGVTSGPMSFAVHQYLHILAAAERGEWDEVSAAQQAVTSVFASMQEDPRRFADLQRAKFVMGLGHPLTGEVTDAQAQRVLAAVRELPRPEDRARIAQSLDLMGDGPYHHELRKMSS